MSKIINIAREQAQKNAEKEAEQRKMLENQNKLLEEQLNELKELVLKEIRNLNGIETKNGKLEVVEESYFNRIAIVYEMSHLNSNKKIIIYISARIEKEEYKYSDESDIIKCKIPIIQVMMTHEIKKEITFNLTNKKDSDEFFEKLGKALAYLF